MKNMITFIWAAKTGNSKYVKKFLNSSWVDPSDNNCNAIVWASGYGHREIVGMLLDDKRVDPGAENNYAIKWASKNGHLEIVRLLLNDNRVDPSAGKNAAIRWASMNGHYEVVKLLFGHTRSADNENTKRLDVIKNWQWTYHNYKYYHVDLQGQIRAFLLCVGRWKKDGIRFVAKDMVRLIVNYIIE
jgi:ankyrin repeat protein